MADNEKKKVTPQSPMDAEQIDCKGFLKFCFLSDILEFLD